MIKNLRRNEAKVIKFKSIVKRTFNIIRIILLTLFIAIITVGNILASSECLSFQFANYRFGIEEPYVYCVTMDKGTEYTVPLEKLYEMEAILNAGSQPTY